MNTDVTYYPKEAILKAAETLPTPFFLYEEKRLRENCRRFKNAFERHFKGTSPFGDFWPLFAVKANPNPALLKIIQDEGFGFDVSSAAEVWIVDKMNPHGGNQTVKGMHTGNFLPPNELREASQAGFILNLDDVAMLEDFEEMGKPETLSLRINPGLGKGGYESLVTAGPKAKYGIPFENAAEAYAQARQWGVKHFGIHMMTGSNILDEDYFPAIVERLFEIIKDLPVEIEFMNMGGGFGVPYRPEEESLNLEKVAQGIREVFDRQCKKYGLKEPRLLAEPGRIIAANAGWLVSKVVLIKESYKKYVGIDASSNDMPRPSIYGAYHHVSVTHDAPEEVVSVVGSICENNDQLAIDRSLPRCERGDVVVIHHSGGHAYAMGHNYNGKLRHAEYVLEQSGALRPIRRAETIEDLYQTLI